MARWLQTAPSYQKYLAVSLTPDGQASSPTALENAARDRVVVRLFDLKA